MTATTDRVPLAEAARKNREQGVAAAKQRLDERRADYAERAPKEAAWAAKGILGEYAEQATWTPSGEPDDPWGSTYYYSATAEIDGLRFEGVAARDYEGTRKSLYLLWSCPNTSHQPADRRIEVNSLSQLADLLDLGGGGLGTRGNCAACYFQREEEGPTDEAPTPPPSAEERLVEAIETLIETRIGQRLDGFLATYLPDRV